MVSPQLGSTACSLPLLTLNKTRLHYNVNYNNKHPYTSDYTKYIQRVDGIMSHTLRVETKATLQFLTNNLAQGMIYLMKRVLLIKLKRIFK